VGHIWIVVIKEMSGKKHMNLFDLDEVVRMGRMWIIENRYRETGNDSLDAYYNGLADGVERVLFLLSRTGD